MPQDLLVEAPKGNDLLAGKDLLADKGTPTPEEPEVKKDDSFSGGMERGFLERGVGVDKMLNNVGLGSIVPQFVNGKVVFGLPPDEQLEQYRQKLEGEGRGTGVKGSVAETVGDPVTYTGAGKLGLAASGAVQAGLSAFTDPAAKTDQSFSKRLESTGISGAIGAATGGILGHLGGKEIFGAKPTGGIGEGDTLYKTLNQLGVKLTGKEKPEEIWNKIQTAYKGKIDELADKVAPGSSTSKVWSVGANLAISQTYAMTRAAGTKLYDSAKQIGAKLEAPIEGIKSDIDALLEEAQKDVISPSINPKFATALGKLKDLQMNLTSKGAPKDPWDKIMHIMQHGEEEAQTVTGTQLIELDQALNQLYGRSGQGGAGGRAYSQLQSKVNDTIKGMSPEFGAAYQKAKDFWKSNIVQQFKENKELHKFWKPEDFDAFQDMARGIPLNPNLKTRVVDQLDKISDWNSLDVLKKQLPPQMYDTVRSAKFLDVMDKAGLDAKAITDDKTYALLSKAVGDKPEDAQALDAIKTFAEQMQKRGIGNKMSAEDLKESDKLLDRSIRTTLGFATKHQLYGLTHAWDLIRGKTTAETTKGSLRKLATDAAAGAPKPEMEMTGVPGAILKPAATEEGKVGPAVVH